MKKHSSPHSNIEKILKRIAWTLAAAIGVLLLLIVGYWIGYGQGTKELTKERERTAELIEQIKDIAKIDGAAVSVKETEREGEIKRLRKQLHEVLERERNREAVMPQHEYAPKDKTATPPPSYKRPKIEPGAEAKLVIIIDDVSYEHDVEGIRATGLPLTMSFLPPSSRHPESADLARSQSRYMVHLPLEALNYDSEEPSTLRIGDTTEEMTRRIEQLKQLYPGVRYMNNHTGSKFTADSEAMDRLIGVLKKEGIQFVDSRTTAETKAPEMSEKYGMRYMGRDVFLDHKDGVANVKKQIAEAVEKAKRHGTAIAIGHPRPDTLKALKQSKELLSEVKLVSIDQI